MTSPRTRDVHPLDAASAELVQYLNTEPAILAEAFRGGYRTPFAAPLSEKEKLAYYQQKMYNTKPDGTINYDSPNEAGREELIKALGIEGYTQVSTVVLGHKNRMMSPEVEEAAQTSSYDIPDTSTTGEEYTPPTEEGY